MKEMDRNVLSAAFHVTIPVLMGYLAIGMAFGLMMDSAGYNVFWALLMSLIIYAGAGQYMGVTLLAAGASPLQTALMTLLPSRTDRPAPSIMTAAGSPVPGRKLLIRF